VNESNDARRVEFEAILAQVLDGTAGEDQQRRMAELLNADESLRPVFWNAMRLHAALGWHFLPGQPLSPAELRLFSQAENLTGDADQTPPTAPPAPSTESVVKHLTSTVGNPLLPFRWPGSGSLFLIAILIGVLAIGPWLLLRRSSHDIAWLVNAQNCQWESNTAPDGEFTPGRVLALQSGLAEIRFQSGAQVLLQGPATLELLSANSAKLTKGKLSAQVPPAARGFQIHAPNGKVVDLGTEFGISVEDDGQAQVVVFQGQVDAYSNQRTQRPINLTTNQAATIDRTGVTLVSEQVGAERPPFARAIVAPPLIIPRVFELDLRNPPARGIRDAQGQAIGLSDRLPSTGKAYRDQNDPNIRLDQQNGRLEIQTTESDINNAHQLAQGEYLGVRLADLGFTGSEDFEVTITLLNLPTLGTFDQIGLYAGFDSGRNIRGGLIGHSEQPGQATQFLVNHEFVIDKHQQFVGVSPQQSDIVLTLRRSNNRYSLTSENRTTGASVAVTTTHPAFLDDVKDMHVGLFGANTRTQESRQMIIKDFKVTVWTLSTNRTAPIDKDDASN